MNSIMSGISVLVKYALTTSSSWAMAGQSAVRAKANDKIFFILMRIDN